MSLAFFHRPDMSGMSPAALAAVAKDMVAAQSVTTTRADTSDTSVSIARSQHGAPWRVAKHALRLCLFGGALWLVTRIGLAALREGFGLERLPTPLAILDHRLPLVLRLHMLAGGLALMALPWVFAARPWRGAHRWLGRVAAALMLLAAAAALPSALASTATPLARAGFLVQGVLCLGLLVGAIDAARRGRRARHRRLMACVAALIAGAVVLRFMLMAAVAWRLPFAPAYAVIAWVSWGLPLALVWFWLVVASPQPRTLLRSSKSQLVGPA